ncbi:autophagy protein (Atg22) [Purpureocillium lilacinum]|uniref:Autophagy-related protein n=1 Tax=Purpureocillium lilacinum TaxID=33203 RepID=A0A179HHJ8_PURLI|nr:autophagy protein (Atg22) [Purpureocillium lilacinum]OAQ67495.1 autophagy protein (Atg22) [Purpureocillium lilacinum]OAQ89687.1 autophagy protein (Atg22) [Purpureocillium lilacinum]PWI68171.1 hypothetical protein PCL_01940 [Purpureocillium lilacinum]GJN76939.1 hypothetical protein PLIIFM63780_000427 [Purpureocillium lilacinum]
MASKPQLELEQRQQQAPEDAPPRADPVRGLVGDELLDNDDDAVPETTRREVWAWYAYYVGANGLALFNYGPTAFQSLLQQAADADTNTSSPGLLPFAGRERDVNSILLIANGVSFASQAALFLLIGAYADFGPSPVRRAILLAWSLVGWAVGFAWLAVRDPSQWRAATGLYILGLIAYQLTLTYWTAAFPELARNAPGMREARREAAQTGLVEGLLRRDELERSRLSNVAFWAQSVGELGILAIIVGILFGLGYSNSADVGPAANSRGLSIVIAFTAGCWLVLSAGWFLLEKRRPGRAIPAGRGPLTVGLWQLREAAVLIWRLRQSLIFLAGYFLLGDSLNTTVTVIATLQNQIVSYSTLTLTYLLIVGIAAQAAGIGAFWLIQRRFRLGPKAMFCAVMVGIVLLDAWGMVGNWTDRFGFRNPWEVWAYQAFYGLFVCPWYSYSQIMISSVTPPGHEFLFFSVFNVIGKASSFIGPLISSAIIDASPGGNNNSAPFYFLFALSLVSAVAIWIFVDLDKSAKEQADFLAQEKKRLAVSSDDDEASGVKLGEPDAVR